MLDLRKLGMLSALERLGTLAAVAEELHLTAPGVSMQLAALEREVGMPLTERSGRRLALTPAGRTLATHGRDLLDRLALADLEVDALRRGAAGTYRIAAFPSAARAVIADVWQRIDAEDGIELTLTTPEPESALAELVAGEVDLAVVHDYSNVPRRLPGGVIAERIGEEPVWLAVAAEDPLAGTADLAAFADRPWIAPEPGLTCAEMVERACGLAGFRPRVVARSIDFAAQLALVRAGAGVALVPDLTVAGVPDGVVLVRPEPSPRRVLFAARRAAMRGEPGLDRLVAALRDACAAAVRDETPSSAPGSSRT